jgi:hypothetical protein
MTEYPRKDGVTSAPELPVWFALYDIELCEGVTNYNVSVGKGQRGAP